jgi:hypothetical protein
MQRQAQAGLQDRIPVSKAHGRCWEATGRAVPVLMRFQECNVLYQDDTCNEIREMTACSLGKKGAAVTTDTRGINRFPLTFSWVYLYLNKSLSFRPLNLFRGGKPHARKSQNVPAHLLTAMIYSFGSLKYFVELGKLN